MEARADLRGTVGRGILIEDRAWVVATLFPLLGHVALLGLASHRR